MGWKLEKCKLIFFYIQLAVKFGTKWQTIFLLAFSIAYHLTHSLNKNCMFSSGEIWNYVSNNFRLIFQPSRKIFYHICNTPCVYISPNRPNISAHHFEAIFISSPKLHLSIKLSLVKFNSKYLYIFCCCKLSLFYQT